MPTPAFPTPAGIPDANYVVARLGGIGDAQLEPFLEYMQGAVNVILKLIENYWKIPLTGATLPRPITTERVQIPDSVFYAMTEWRPIQTLTKATIGTTNLRIGTLQQLAQGKVDVAIGNTVPGNVIRFGGVVRSTMSWAQWNGPAEMFVDYTAGYAQMPDDMLEVFFRLCQLVYKQKERDGIKKSKIGQRDVELMTELPTWAIVTLAHYKPIEAFR